MYQKFLLLILSFPMAFQVLGRNVRLSAESEITVMTMGPYQGELYSAFGHSAFHVIDSVNNIDWVYNYGVFNFRQENFYLNFAKGKTLYQLGLSYYKPFREGYVNQDRSVREQYLNLSQDEKQAFFDFLQKNYKPENREYLYNYVYDNCATKIRDVVEAVFPQQVTFGVETAGQGKTIRHLMHDYLDYQPWGTLGIDIGLGLQIDKEAPDYDYMFLPDYVFDAFSTATIVTNGVEKSLVKETVIVHSPGNLEIQNGWLTPLNFFVLLFFIGGFITHLNMKRGKRTRWLDGLIFGFAGIAGFWLVFLWAGTLHLSTWNLDLLWAIPFHLPVVFMLRSVQWKKRLAMYFKIVWIWYALLLLAWAILPGQINMALVPFTLLLLLRAFYISWDLKKAKGSNGVSRIYISNFQMWTS